jgi:hypothetical protein
MNRFVALAFEEGIAKEHNQWGVWDAEQEEWWGIGLTLHTTEPDAKRQAHELNVMLEMRMSRKVVSLKEFAKRNTVEKNGETYTYETRDVDYEK